MNSLPIPSLPELQQVVLIKVFKREKSKVDTFILYRSNDQGELIELCWEGDKELICDDYLLIYHILLPILHSVTGQRFAVCRDKDNICIFCRFDYIKTYQAQQTKKQAA